MRKGKYQPNTYLLLGALIVVLVIGYFLYHRYQTNHNYLHRNGYTTSTTKSPANGNVVPGGSTGQGGAVDKNGKTTPPAQQTPTPAPTTSQSGDITVTQPGQNNTLASGNTIAGNATVPSVQFRLIDLQVGVIAQGSLNVVNGKFSGVLSFRHQSSTGRLDVYSYNSSGAEINEVQIPVKF